MSLKRYRRLWFVLALALQSSAADAVQVVTEPFLGVRHIHQTETSPRPLNIHVVEIDLSAPGIRFQMTPRTHGGPEINGAPAETIRQTTRQFANAVGAQVAINGSFYALEVPPTSWANNLSLTASNGDKYSPWETGEYNDNSYDDALNITQNNQARFVKKPPSTPLGFETIPSVTLYNTVTGNHRLLQSNVMVAPTSCSVCGLNPRTAVGLTANNAKLILMTVDDANPAPPREGVTLIELANLLASHGATNAINLDGGGSTTMVMNFYNDADAAQVLNIPSDGSERSVGNNLALFALPNGDFNQDGVVDAADYVVWRKTIGGQLAYDAWRSHFDAPASGLGGGSSIPEPSMWALTVLALSRFLVGRHGRACRSRASCHVNAAISIA